MTPYLSLSIWVPIVAGVGGLADTVTDAADEKNGTGFVFNPVFLPCFNQFCSFSLWFLIYLYFTIN